MDYQQVCELMSGRASYTLHYWLRAGSSVISEMAGGVFVLSYAGRNLITWYPQDIIQIDTRALDSRRPLRSETTRYLINSNINMAEIIKDGQKQWFLRLAQDSTPRPFFDGIAIKRIVISSRRRE